VHGFDPAALKGDRRGVLPGSLTSRVAGLRTPARRISLCARSNCSSSSLLRAIVCAAQTIALESR